MEGVPYRVFDDFLPDERRAELYEYLMEPTWEWGWRSHRQTDQYRFWHKHFAGARRADRRNKDGTVRDRGQDCAEELRGRAPLIWCFWEDVSGLLLKGHKLVRCYANGLQYGSDGTIHTDSVVPTSFTSVYYPHAVWEPNWGGETMFFDRAKRDVIGCSFPRPGRLVCFPGTVPHIARGVSRTCPLLRITLMFKTEGPGHVASVNQNEEVADGEDD